MKIAARCLLSLFWILISVPVLTVSAQSQNFLSAAEIQHELEGNTIRFANARGSGEVYIYFGAGGTAEQRLDQLGSSVTEKKWWIDEDRQLCRESGRSNRRLCRKVSIEGKTVSFYEPNGKLHYQAALLTGKRLPE